jgi:ribosome recycling factor
MDVNDLKGLYAEVNKRMNTAHRARAARARRRPDRPRHRTILDPRARRSLRVADAAQPAGRPLDPEPTMIVAQPFDPSQLGAIEKAIRASDLGLNPSNDGKVVRIPIRR